MSSLGIPTGECVEYDHDNVLHHDNVWLWPWKLVTTWQGVTTVDGAEKEGRTPQLGRSRGVRIGPGATQNHYCYDHHHHQISCFSMIISPWIPSWSNVMFLIVRYGKSCASTCGKGDNDYHWCWVGWHLEDVILIYLSSPCSYGSEQRISYLLLALCDFRTGSTAHQWVKPDMGRLVLETALRGGRITGDVCIQLFYMLITSIVPGGATRTKKKKSGNTAPHLERSLPFKLISPHWTVFWFIWVWCSLQVLDTAYTVNGQDCVGECGTQGEKYWWEWCRLFCLMNAGVNFLQTYVFLAPQVL